MKQIWITGHGGPEKLGIREAVNPAAKAGEVRIRFDMKGLPSSR